MAEKVWDDHVVAAQEGEPDLIYIDLHLVHEVTSPQAFDGLRLAGRPVRRPDLTIATEDHNVPDHRHRQADRRPGVAHPGRDAAAQLRGVRRPAAPDGRRRAGHRAHHRPAARSDPAGHDGRLRRQPHLHPRRVRRAWRWASAPPRSSTCSPRRRCRCKPFKTMAINVDGHAAAGRHRQGHHPGGDRQDRHRRRPGLRHRIPRQRHRSAVDGGPDDGLQHDHRGRRPRRHGRARRDHLRLPQGPPARADRRRLGSRGRRLGPAAHRRGRRIRHRGLPRRGDAEPVRHLGHQPRAGCSAVGGGARSRS